MDESKKAIEAQLRNVTTTSAEDIAIERERLTRELEAAAAAEGLCSTCSAPVMPAAIHERAEWALAHLAAFAQTARAHLVPQMAIVRAVGGAPVDMLRVDVRELDAVMRRSVEPVIEELRGKLDRILALAEEEESEESEKEKGEVLAAAEESAEEGERVDWVAFVQSGEMTPGELNDYIHSLHQASAELRAKLENVREEMREEAALEYDGRTARACAMLEGEIEELRALLMAAGLDPSRRGEAAEEALASSLAPIVEERRRQRVKYGADHDARNGAASWTATLAQLLASYAATLYMYDHARSAADMSRAQIEEAREGAAYENSQRALARIGAVAAAAIEAAQRKIAAREAQLREERKRDAESLAARSTPREEAR